MKKSIAAIAFAAALGITTSAPTPAKAAGPGIIAPVIAALILVGTLNAKAQSMHAYAYAPAEPKATKRKKHRR